MLGYEIDDLRCEIMRCTQAEPFLFRLYNVECRILLFREPESQPPCIFFDSFQAGEGMSRVGYTSVLVEHTVDYDTDLSLYIPPINIL